MKAMPIVQDKPKSVTCRRDFVDAHFPFQVKTMFENEVELPESFSVMLALCCLSAPAFLLYLLE